MSQEHSYKARIVWTGNTGKGTASYREYQRDHSIEIDGKQAILGSSDPSFRGDPTRHNPEEMLVASLSSCHMLWFLHLCCSHKIVVTAYHDDAEGYMIETEDGGGFFEEVILKPKVTITDPEMVELCEELHEKANALCFIANSVNFPIIHKPSTKVSE